MSWVGLQSVKVSFPGHTHFVVFGPGFRMHFIFGNHLVEEEIVFLRLLYVFSHNRSGFPLFLPTYWYQLVEKIKTNSRMSIHNVIVILK